MKRIRILENVMGAPSSTRTRPYLAGEEFNVGDADMPEDLANVFLCEGWAEEIEQEAEQEVEKPKSRKRKAQ